MKLYEKIVLSILLMTLAMLPFDIVYKKVYFHLATILLSFSYLIGGYWLLNNKEKNYTLFSILAGIAFCSSLLFIALSIFLYNKSFYKFLPIGNGLLLITLGIFYFKNRSRITDLGHIKGIILRSVIVLVSSTFIFYSTPYFGLYRKAMITLNNGNYHKQNYLLTFDYIIKSEKALDNKNCDQAIYNSEEALRAGGKWLGLFVTRSKTDSGDFIEESKFDLSTQYNLIDSISYIKDTSKLWKIDGVFSKLYESYVCKANYHNDNSEYELALPYYLKADKALELRDSYSRDTYSERASSYNRIGICYKNLRNYYHADSFFIKAIEFYDIEEDTLDENMATYFTNYGISLSEQSDYDSSNEAFQTALSILENLEVEEKPTNSIVNLYERQAINYLTINENDIAYKCIEELIEMTADTSKTFCRANMYLGIYHYKINEFRIADSILTDALACYTKRYAPNHQKIADNYLFLGLNNIGLGKFEKAQSNIDTCLYITSQNYDTKSYKYALYSMHLANLKNIIGEYSESKIIYKNVIDIFTEELGYDTDKVAQALSQLSTVEITLGQFDIAKYYSDQAMELAKQHYDLELPSATLFYNNDAYVKYSIGKINQAEKLYSKSLKINSPDSLTNLDNYLHALNGLGLVLTRKGNYKKADALFKECLKLSKQFYTENHPFTASIMLNYAELEIKRKRYKGAKLLLDKAKGINQNFFDENHIVFAHINMAFGDLNSAKKSYIEAKLYYKNAFDTYLDKFGEEHYKTVLARKRVGIVGGR